MSRARVLILGGGMAGASLGAALAVDHDVVVLEAEPLPAVHSTGRSAALFVQDYGPTAVQALTRASAPHFAEISNSLGVPLLHRRGAMLTAWSEPVAQGLSALAQTSEHLRPLARQEAVRLCPALRAELLEGAVIDETAADIDVLALHDYFLRTLTRLGGVVAFGERVEQVRKDASGWTVTSSAGTRSGDVLVNAAGAWADHVAGLCGVRPHGLTPARRTVAIARATVPAEWPVVADATESWYFKPESGGLLISPADETRAKPGDVRPAALDVALAIDRVNAHTTLNLRSVQTSWAGLRTFAEDRAPVVGPHPDEPTLFCFVGQGGYGIQMAPALAAVGAEMLRTGTLDDEELSLAIRPDRHLTLSHS